MTENLFLINLFDEVFNTGMTGYQEVVTDPSYRGQIVTFTCPELGNTGVTPEDEESDRPQVRGVIARNPNDIMRLEVIG